MWVELFRLLRSDANRLCTFNEIRPRKDKRGVDLISDVLPFGRLWYGGSNAVSNAIGYARHYNRSDDAVIRVYDAGGNPIETHEHKGDFKEWVASIESRAEALPFHSRPFSTV